MTAADGPVVEKCPNCGAPLKLDVAGDCVWCEAHVRVAHAPVVQPERVDAERARRVLFGNMLEGEPGDIMLLQPVSNLLVFLETTGQEEAVEDFLAVWEHKDAVPGLLRAVRAAGTRVTLAAKAEPGFDEFTDHSARYSAEEWWVVELANDLLSLLAALPGVDPMRAVDDAGQVRDIREQYSARFGTATAPAGEDGRPLLAMRASVPQAEVAPPPAPAPPPASPAPAPADQPDAGGDERAEGRHHFWRHRGGG